MKLWILALLALVLSTGCARNPPPNTFTGVGMAMWRADRAVLVVEKLQLAVVVLHSKGVTGVTDANTRVVIGAVTDALSVIEQTPDGWRAAISTALDRASARLDAAGLANIGGYIAVVQVFLSARETETAPDVLTDDMMRVILARDIARVRSVGTDWIAAHP